MASTVIPLHQGATEPSRQTEQQQRYHDRLLELTLQPQKSISRTLWRILRATAAMLDGAGVGFWRCTHDSTVLTCEVALDGRGRVLRDKLGARLDTASLPQWLPFLRNGQAQILVAPAERKDSPWPLTETDWLALNAVSSEGALYGVLLAHRAQTSPWADNAQDDMKLAARVLSAVLRQAQAVERLEQLAWRDPLTDLPNRHYMRELVRTKIASAMEQNKHLAVMLVDLDCFKSINDTLGHQAGDALIKSVAQALTEAVGAVGTVGRLGGDEFIVLTEEFAAQRQRGCPAEISQLAERIVRALNRTDLLLQADAQTSASVGIALFPEHGADFSALLKSADIATYQAKQDGRNRYNDFDAARYARAVQEVRLGVDLRKALESGAQQFSVVYQPQVEIRTGKVVGLEALLRWQHPQRGLVGPDAFISAAEASGLSEWITRWMVDAVCAQIAQWERSAPGLDIPVAINVAGRELGSTSLPAIVRTGLLQHRVSPQRICLEITERTLAHDSDVNSAVIAELVALGVGMVLDDFGTGFSMLGYLKRLPIQAIKLDQSFVRGVPADADNSAIIQAILSVARQFRLKVIAEGVEHQEQANFLSSLGCEYAQGHLYFMALAPNELLANPGMLLSHCGPGLTDQ